MEVTVKDKTLTCIVKNQQDLDTAMYIRDRFNELDGEQFIVELSIGGGAPVSTPAPAKTAKPKSGGGKKKTADTKPAPTEEAPEAPAPAAPAYKETAQEKLKQYAALAGVDKAREALAKYNAQKISDLSDEDRQKFVADLDKGMPTNG